MSIRKLRLSIASRLTPLLKIKSERSRGTYEPDDPSRDYEARSDWTRSDGQLNYSSFVFFDVDRDGCYGLGDRPMGGIRVRLLKDGRQVASARTNTNGFANFTTSTRKRKAPIGSPGRYEFVVSVPGGWAATSGNDRQVAEFKLVPGSSSGIGADEMIKPVGLAPDRVLRGRLLPGAALSVEALHRGSVVDESELSNQVDFRYRVPDTADEIGLSIAGSRWRVAAYDYPVDVGLLDPGKGSLDPGRTVETIGFDDVNPRGLRKIPSGYAGLSWFNLNAMGRDFAGSSEGYVNGNTSGEHIAYTSSGHPAELYADAPFDFIGVHLTAAWLKSEGEIGRIESWRGDRLVASDAVVLSALTPVYYNPMLPCVARVRFSTDHQWQMVLDDLVIAR
jgi:hypothetical protein